MREKSEIVAVLVEDNFKKKEEKERKGQDFGGGFSPIRRSKCKGGAKGCRSFCYEFRLLWIAVL